MTAERLAPESEEKIEIRREDFAPGRTGEMAYMAVLSGSPCVAYVDEEKTKCGLTPIGTVDIDIRGELDFFTYCSEEHALTLTDQLEREVEATGGFTYPARNGFGRA